MRLRVWPRAAMRLRVRQMAVTCGSDAPVCVTEGSNVPACVVKSIHSGKLKAFLAATSLNVWN